MAVRFVLGRAGAGKTRHCLVSIRAELADSALGKPLILLVPEQATAQMERALLAEGELKGTFRAQVLSFRRLVYKVQAGVGTGKGIIPSVTERMILRHVLQQQLEHLKVYGAVVDRPGLVNKLLENLKELIAERCEPDDLRQTASRLGSGHLADKLEDLAVLLQAYLEYVGRHGLERTGVLDELTQRIGQTPWLAGTRIWVDAFAGFTAQETQVLVELAQCCRHMDICLLMDADYRLGQGKRQVNDPLRLFGQTEQTYAKLSEELTEAGVQIEEPLMLDKASMASAADLAQLERNLFGLQNAVGGQVEHVRLAEAADRRSEVEAVVREIVRLSRRKEDPLRYREMAIIVRDLPAYHDLLAGCLAEHRIAFFIDRRSSLAHHGLVELLLNGLAVLEEDFSVQSVRALMKTGLLGIEQERLDRLENYLLAHGIKGLGSWQGKDWGYRGHMILPGDMEDVEPDEREDLARINETRREIIERLGQWCAWAGTAEPVKTVREWTCGIVELLERLEVGEQLSRWADNAQQQGHEELAQQHRRVWESLAELLEQMVAVLGDEQVTLSQLKDLIQAPMAEFTLGLVPPKLDQVLVGSVQRSRHPALRAAFVIGMNEGLFPKSVSQDPVLLDAERTLLEKQELRLGPTAQERFFRERLLAYIALTRGRDYLWISYAAADEKGKALNVSPFVQEIKRALPDLEVEVVSNCRDGDEPGSASTPGRLAGALAGRFAAGLEELPTKIKQRWLGTYTWLARRGKSDDKAKGILSSLVYENLAYLDKEKCQQLLGDTLRTSKTGLEAFAACPFAYFAERTLKLQPREDAGIADVDLGRLYHRAMEKLGRELIKQGTRLGQMSRAQAVERIEQISAELVGELAKTEPQLQKGRNQFLSEHMQRELCRAVAAGHLRNTVGQLYPVAVEQKFGLEQSSDAKAEQADDSWPSLVFGLGQNKSMELRGIIDLLELADSEQANDRLRYAVVYDYKRSREKKFELSRLFYGLDLQLLIYLMAVRELGSEKLGAQIIEPIGGFYVSLRGAGLKKAKSDEEHDQEKLLSRSRPRGLFRTDKLGLMDNSKTGRLRAVHGTLRKSDGKLGARGSDGLSPEDFETVLAYGRKVIRRLGHEILSGKILIKPYRRSGCVPCTYCDYRWVCRIDRLTNSHNELTITNNAQALEQMRQEK